MATRHTHARTCTPIQHIHLLVTQKDDVVIWNQEVR